MHGNVKKALAVWSFFTTTCTTLTGAVSTLEEGTVRLPLAGPAGGDDGVAMDNKTFFYLVLSTTEATFTLATALYIAYQMRAPGASIHDCLQYACIGDDPRARAEDGTEREASAARAPAARAPSCCC